MYKSCFGSQSLHYVDRRKVVHRPEPDRHSGRAAVQRQYWVRLVQAADKRSIIEGGTARSAQRKPATNALRWCKAGTVVPSVAPNTVISR
jgi:hypothetical protein